jgi:hypothetical protein
LTWSVLRLSLHSGQGTKFGGLATSKSYFGLAR